MAGIGFGKGTSNFDVSKFILAASEFVHGRSKTHLDTFELLVNGHNSFVTQKAYLVLVEEINQELNDTVPSA